MAGERQWRLQGAVPRETDEPAQPLDLGLRLGDQPVVARHAPALAGQLRQVVEEVAGGVGPLLGDDLGERLAAQAAPPRDEQQGPRLPGPSRELGIRHEAARPPGVEHRGERLARVAVEVDEARIRECRCQERYAQGVLGCLLEQPELCLARRRRFPVAVTQRREERLLEPRGSVGVRVGRDEAVGLEAAPRRVQSFDPFDDAVAFAADRPRARRQRERLEQQRAAGARRADDEHRPMDAVTALGPHHGAALGRGPGRLECGSGHGRCLLEVRRRRCRQLGVERRPQHQRPHRVGGVEPVAQGEAAIEGVERSVERAQQLAKGAPPLGVIARARPLLVPRPHEAVQLAAQLGGRGASRVVAGGDLIEEKGHDAPLLGRRHHHRMGSRLDGERGRRPGREWNQKRRLVGVLRARDRAAAAEQLGERWRAGRVGDQVHAGRFARIARGVRPPGVVHPRLPHRQMGAMGAANQVDVRRGADRHVDAVAAQPVVVGVGVQSRLRLRGEPHQQGPPDRGAERGEDLSDVWATAEQRRRAQRALRPLVAGVALGCNEHGDRKARVAEIGRSPVALSEPAHLVPEAFAVEMQRQADEVVGQDHAQVLRAAARLPACLPVCCDSGQ